jgi:hypothetical protein
MIARLLHVPSIDVRNAATIDDATFEKARGAALKVTVTS